MSASPHLPPKAVQPLTANRFRFAPMSATGIPWSTFRKPTKHPEAWLAEMDGRLPFIRPGLNGNVVPQADIDRDADAPILAQLTDNIAFANSSRRSAPLVRVVSIGAGFVAGGALGSAAFRCARRAAIASDCRLAAEPALASRCTKARAPVSATATIQAAATARHRLWSRLRREAAFVMAGPCDTECRAVGLDRVPGERERCLRCAAGMPASPAVAGSATGAIPQ
jgi:hypothetical protein